jgi:hypothetical protein
MIRARLVSKARHRASIVTRKSRTAIVTATAIVIAIVIANPHVTITMMTTTTIIIPPPRRHIPNGRCTGVLGMSL